MAYTTQIRLALKELHPDTNQSSLDTYVSQTEKIYQNVFGINLNRRPSLKLGKGGMKAIESYLSQFADTTKANYYSSVLEVMKAMKFNPVVAEKFKEKRDQEAEKYNKIQDGLKSKKQEEQFVSAKLLDDLIKKYTQEIKGGSEDRDLMQIWMILKLLKKFRFRNEVATLEFVDKNTYDTEKEKGTTNKNMIVLAPQGWFISKNKYKTQKKYGEEIIPLKGGILKDLEFFYEKVGKGPLFRSSFQQTKRPTTMTPNALSKYLIRWSNKALPPVKNADGSKKPRNLSTTMITKVYESAELGEAKKSLIKDSKNRGNKPETMMKVYVSSKKPKI